MTLQELTEYLTAIGQGGFKAPQLTQIVSVAIGTAYAAVWGAYDWKIKRALFSGATVSTQEYTNLPSDFEAIAGCRILDATSPLRLDIKTESAFDEDHPFPSNDSAGTPVECKVVLDSGTTWRIYWYPVPNAAYTIRAPYFKRADPTFLPMLPSYMLGPIIERATGLVQPAAERRAMFFQTAKALLSEAIMADCATAGVALRLGSDPGWDDWSGECAEWDPFAAVRP